jgi:hypothetical protein
MGQVVEASDGLVCTINGGIYVLEFNLCKLIN